MTIIESMPCEAGSSVEFCIVEVRIARPRSRHERQVVVVAVLRSESVVCGRRASICGLPPFDPSYFEHKGGRGAHISIVSPNRREKSPDGACTGARKGLNHTCPRDIIGCAVALERATEAAELQCQGHAHSMRSELVSGARWRRSSTWRIAHRR